MLKNVHVKNFALIKEIEISFHEHLNILSGETGAGKSILLNSIFLSLGSKSDADFIRTGESEASSELTFTLSDSELEEFSKTGFPTDGNEVILSRRITERRSVSRINGETVPVSSLSTIGNQWMEVAGQREQVTLLREENHLNIIDSFGKEAISSALISYQNAYDVYRKANEVNKSFLSEEERISRIEELTDNIRELKEFNLKPKEEEELRNTYKRMADAKTLLDRYNEIRTRMEHILSEDFSEVGKHLDFLSKTDSEMTTGKEAFQTAESILEDFSRDIEDKIDSLTYSEEDFQKTEERILKLRNLKNRFSVQADELPSLLTDMEEELRKLQLFEEEKEENEQKFSLLKADLTKKAQILHDLREDYGKTFADSMEKALKDLNFLSVQFKVSVEKTNRYTKSGADSVNFLISLNPGEPLKPLLKVASGGELSRILLAIHSLVSLTETPYRKTFVFDEIDEGISGMTAGAVAKNIHGLARNHQVIAISHLPQVVAVSDHHFKIEKTVSDGKTVTTIRELTEEESIYELARLLSADNITEKALDNARELRLRLRGEKNDN